MEWPETKKERKNHMKKTVKKGSDFFFELLLFGATFVVWPKFFFVRIFVHSLRWFNGFSWTFLRSQSSYTQWDLVCFIFIIEDFSQSLSLASSMLKKQAFITEWKLNALSLAQEQLHEACFHFCDPFEVNDSQAKSMISFKLIKFSNGVYFRCTEATHQI